MHGVKIADYQSIGKMLQIEDMLAKRLGFAINPKSHLNCHKLLINRFGLPAIFRERKGRDGDEIKRSRSPSFDKDALEDYLRQPGLGADVIEVLAAC